MSAPEQKPEPITEAEEVPSLETTVELGKRAFALKKYEEAVEHYATALQIITEMFGEDGPETADLYFIYGKALLENAISQSTVLGKGEENEPEPEDDKAANGAILSFSGDVEETVDMFAEAEAAGIAEDAAEEEENDGDEPEDDFNAAWEVLDLARAIYLKQTESGNSDEQVQMKLADTYITLGDVSLETEKFDQAITDYEAGLGLKLNILPLSSRQIAEAHYKLSIVLDLTSGRLADAIVHAEKALESIEARLSVLAEALANPSPAGEASPAETKMDVKGKGKAPPPDLAAEEKVSSLSPAQINSEIKELTELKGDLGLKIEELKTTPNDATTGQSAPALAAQALDAALNTGTSGANSGAVNDLTTMVKKKKKGPEESNAAKRKAEDDGDISGSEKKPKMDRKDA